MYIYIIQENFVFPVQTVVRKHQTTSDLLDSPGNTTKLTLKRTALDNTRLVDREGYTNNIRLSPKGRILDGLLEKVEHRL